MLVFPIFLSSALPILDNARAQSVPSEKASNSSLLYSGASIPSPPSMMGDERKSVDSSRGENPSLLTSIPSFAPPGAVRRRDDNWAINIPNPSIALGIPSVPAIKSYFSRRLHGKQQRTPKAEILNPQPPASTDAVQPHKEPVPDSTVDFIHGTGQRQKPDSPNQPKKNAADDETNTKDSANRFSDTIHNLASTGSATPSPIAYENKVPTFPVSESVDPHSLSHSLGTISHSQFEEEDQGKRRRNLDSKIDEKHRKRVADVGDKGYFGQKLEDYPVPTIWNGGVRVDDLDWWEGQEFDDTVALYRFIQSHRGKVPPSDSSAAGPPTIHPNASSLPAIPTSTTSYNSSASSASTSMDKSPPSPKSLAKGLGLVSHSSFRNKTSLGTRRDKIPDLVVNRGTPRSLDQPASTEPLPAPSREDNSPNAKREDEYDPNLEPIDISDEAYDQFRKKYPKYFGGGGKKVRRVNAIAANDHNPEKRDSAPPNWLAILLSPSALLEKKPVSIGRSSEKRSSTQGTPVLEALWAPDSVPIQSDESLPSNPKGRHRRFSDKPITHNPESRDGISLFRNANMEEDRQGGLTHRGEGSSKRHQDSLEEEEDRQTRAMEVKSRDDTHRYTATAFGGKSGSDDDNDDAFPNKDWFESTFEQAWREEHPKRAALSLDSAAIRERIDDFTHTNPDEDFDTNSWIAFWDWYTGHGAEEVRENEGHVSPDASGANSPGKVKRDGTG